MRLLSRLRSAAVAAVSCALLASSALAADYRISGPHVHENLAVYLLHGTSTPGAVPLTLQEALAKDAVRVVETGSVNQLEIENTSAEEVFVQAGDIVKGGKQDRVLTVTLLLPPKSGKVGIGAFCVEQGRWAARGKEDVQRFASASASLPSREAKLAMALPAKPVGRGPSDAIEARTGAGADRNVAERRFAQQQRVGTLSVEASDTSSRQREVWDKVKKTQEKLSGNLGGSVAAAQSASSLQLSLENERLKQAQKAYVAALQPAGERDADVVGLVVAVNGKLSSADVYPSNGLFRKMWAKQLGASVTEAIGEKDADRVRPTPAIVSGAATDPTASHTPPSTQAVQVFLDAAEKGETARKTISGRMRLETRDGETSLLVEAARSEGGFVHRNYLAK